MVKVVDNTEENKKRAFFQVALTMLKTALNKLVQDAYLREQIAQECDEAWDNIQTQSSKEAQARFLALLSQIEQQLKAYWANKLSPEQAKIMANAFERIKLKAEFAAEEPIIAAGLSAIDAGLKVIEDSLAAITPSSSALEVAPILEAAAKKFMGHYDEYNALRAKVSDYRDRFAAVAVPAAVAPAAVAPAAVAPAVESVSEYRANAPSLDPLAAQDLSQVADVTRETEVLSQYMNMLNALGLRMVTIQDTVRTQTVRHPGLEAGPWVAKMLGLEIDPSDPSMATSPHIFLKAPRPSAGAARKEFDPRSIPSLGA